MLGCQQGRAVAGYSVLSPSMYIGLFRRDAKIRLEPRSVSNDMVGVPGGR